MLNLLQEAAAVLINILDFGVVCGSFAADNATDLRKPAAESASHLSTSSVLEKSFEPLMELLSSCCLHCSI